MRVEDQGCAPQPAGRLNPCLDPSSWLSGSFTSLDMIWSSQVLCSPSDVFIYKRFSGCPRSNQYLLQVRGTGGCSSCGLGRQEVADGRLQVALAEDDRPLPHAAGDVLRVRAHHLQPSIA